MNRGDIFHKLHLDPYLLLFITLAFLIGLAVLYSASLQNMVLIQRQLLNFGIGSILLLVLAQVPPRVYYGAAPWIYGTGLLLLVGVLLVGDAAKGAQRWLDLGFFRFQPSEIMKVALPMMLAKYLDTCKLPPHRFDMYLSLIFIATPALLIAKQPDLGTAILIVASGFLVLFFAGLQRRWLLGGLSFCLMALPALWYVMHDYQKQRVLTFLSPEQDPLGTGYHIIQSKIAIGSGGLFGKGFLQSTQSKLDYLPECTTDFIFSIFSEEFGFFGIFVLFLLYGAIIARGLWMSMQGQDTFSRLLAGSLIMTFFVYVFVNVSMVSGLLPVVGVPFPLISYGGTSLVTLMASFGILMSINTHRRLLSG
jgi:rod shape determining protein RodA